MKTIDIIKVFFLCLFLSTSVGLSAGLLEEADSAYNAGRYPEAVEKYNKIVESQGVSPQLLFNLGNAYSKGGDYGHALMAYKRALLLDPSDASAISNVKYINSKVLEANKSELRGKKYALEPESDSFAAVLKNWIAKSHTSNTWAVWAAVTFALFIISLIAYIFSNAVLLRKIGFFSAFVMLGVSIITLVFAFMAASYRSDEGVVTAAKVKLHVEANSTSKEHAVNLTRGTCMRILDIFPAGVDNPDWYKVKLNSDFIGWISSADFAPVEPVNLNNRR